MTATCHELLECTHSQAELQRGVEKRDDTNWCVKNALPTPQFRDLITPGFWENPGTHERPTRTGGGGGGCGWGLIHQPPNRTQRQSPTQNMNKKWKINFFRRLWRQFKPFKRPTDRGEGGLPIGPHPNPSLGGTLKGVFKVI